MFQEILDAIKSHDSIAIFRHTHPDGDATGSQLGLKEWILTYFKDKDVRALGFDTFKRLPFVDEADDEWIKNALAIVVDTSNVERVDDARFNTAKMVIKIDHHPALDNFGTLNFVDTDTAATAQYLTEILSSFKDYPINEKIAYYLYSGILTDTLNFKTSSTSSRTLLAAATLANTGINIPNISLEMFDESLNTFEIKTIFRSHLKVSNGLGSVVLSKEDLQKLDITPDTAKTYISEFALIRELKIWIVFAENEEGNYDGSLRSRKEYVINEIAHRYGGGGHPNASGIKNITKAQLDQLFNDLNNLLD